MYQTVLEKEDEISRLLERLYSTKKKLVDMEVHVAEAQQGIRDEVTSLS